MPSFVDANILVSAEDSDAGEKWGRARDLIVGLWDTQDGVISVQVLQEFYVTVTRRLIKKMPSKKATVIVEEYLARRVIDNTADLFQSALRLHNEARVSLWDALIVQAALDAGCERLYTEDLNLGQRFSSPVVVNPFQ